MPTLLHRKRDLTYFTFFLLHIPIVFFVDIYPLYPSSLRPQFMTTLRQWYITTYRDAFFIAPPAWFTMYIWMELFYHVPLSVWALGALWRGEWRSSGFVIDFELEWGFGGLC